MLKRTVVAITTIVSLLLSPVFAEDTITIKRMTLELANDVAREAVLACREAGYQVSAVVVDRTANVQSVMRDTLANRFTIEIA